MATQGAPINDKLVNENNAPTTSWIRWFAIIVSAIDRALSFIPVDGVYISSTSTNPSSTLGYGTWSAVGNGAIFAGIADTFYVWKRTA